MALEADLKSFWGVYEPYLRQVESFREETFKPPKDEPSGEPSNQGRPVSPFAKLFLPRYQTSPSTKPSLNKLTIPLSIPSSIVDAKEGVTSAVESCSWRLSWRTDEEDGPLGPFYLLDLVIPAGPGAGYFYTFSPIYKQIGPGQIKPIDSEHQLREELARGIYATPFPDSLLFLPRQAFTAHPQGKSAWGTDRWICEEHKGYFYRSSPRVKKEHPIALLYEKHDGPQGIFVAKFRRFELGTTGIDEFLGHIGASYISTPQVQTVFPSKS